MAKRIVIASQKGGDGKTTVAMNLAVAMSEKERKTLLVDLDPQGAIGHSLAIGETQWIGLAEHLMEKATLEQALIKTKLKSLTILPRGRLDPIDICEYEKALHTPGILEKVLDKTADDFDYVIIDTIAGLGMITRAALAISEFVISPVQGEPLAARTVGQILRVVDHVAKNENPDLKLIGLLPVMVDVSKQVGADVMGEIWTEFDKVMDTVIARDDIFGEASRKGVPVNFLGGPRSQGAIRFEILADEVERRIAQMTTEQGAPDERQERVLI